MSTNASILENVYDLTKKPGIVSRYVWSETIDEVRWSKNYPYQLAIVQADQDGAYRLFEKMVFTLPVNPESLTITTPFASSLTATLGGVVEQNGGVPFRDLQIVGTFGVLPAGGRPVGEELTGGLAQEAEYIAGGTISAAEGVVSSATAAVLGPQFYPNLFETSQLSKGSTGYFQFRQLQKFLESYAEIKKSAAGRQLRLAFIVWKDEAGYLVTPRLFQVFKKVPEVHEYRYTLQLQAWRRIDPATLDWKADAIEPEKSKARGPSVAAQAFQRLDSARNTINGARDTILAVKADYDATVGQFIRQTALLMQDTAGLVKTAADFPANICNAIGADLGKSFAIASNAVDAMKRVNLGNSLAKADFSKAFEDSYGNTRDKGSSATTSASSSSQAGLGKALSNPDNTELRKAIKPDTMKLSDATRALIRQEVARVRNLAKQDFQKMQRDTLAFVSDYASRVGLNGSTYANTMGFSTSQKIRDATDEDYEILAALTEVASVFGRTASSIDSMRPRVPTTIEYVAGIANEAGINMRVPRSKFAVPFPYYGTLERLAAQYLGDPGRWQEIAALNNLRAPYVDEVGFTAALLTNGSGNEVIVGDASKLVLGQSVILYSNTVNPQKRVVLKTEKLFDGKWAMTLSGDADLDTFQISDSATVSYFETHTVHGGQVVYIPSDLPSNLPSPYAPTAIDLNRILQAGDVDGMLTGTGDIAIQPDGDWPFVYGISSIIQWTRTALSTPQGSLLMHPNFGLPISVGQSNADVSAQDLIESIRTMFRNGPSYTGVRSVTATKEGPITRIGFELGVRGVEALIPVSFELLQ